MSGSVMDQLLFLKEYTDGLMTEMYSCFMLQPNMTASVDDALFFRTLDLAEYDKIRKQCNKMFSTFLVQPTNAQLQRTNHLEKLEGYDKLQANARNLAMFLSKYYQLLIAVMNFHAKILEILESFAQGMERLSYEEYPMIVEKYLDTVACYVKLPLLLSRFKDAKAIVYIYGTCYELANHAQDGQYDMMTKFILDYYDHPLDKIRRDFKKILGLHLKGVLLSMFDMYSQLQDTTSLLNSSVFDQESAFSGNPTIQRIFQDMILFPKCHDWVVFVTLGCADLLIEEDIALFFEVVGSKSFVVSIFRDQIINYHDMIGDIMISKAYASSKFQKTITRTAKKAVKNAGVYHQDRRLYLSWVLRNIDHILEHDSGLASPNFQMIHGFLSLSKQEIVWYFQHTGANTPHRVKKSKYYNAKTYTKEKLQDLMYYHAKIIMTVKRTSNAIIEYYTEYLQGSHANSLSDLVSECLQDGAIDQRIQNIMGSMPSALQNWNSPEGNKLSKDESVLKEFRRHWVYLVMYFVRSATTIAKPLQRRMSLCVLHSTYADSLCQSIVSSLELPELYWHRKTYFDIYQFCLNQGYINHAVQMIHTVDCFTQNIHAMYPTEQSQLGTQVPKFADSLFSEIGHVFKINLETMYQQLYHLNEQTRPLEAAQRFKRQQNARKLALKSKHMHPPPPEPLPGMESRPYQEHTLQILHIGEATIVHLCEALRQHPTIRVYDNVFSFESLIKTKISELFRSFLRAMATVKDGVIERPSIMLSKLEIFFCTVQRISNRTQLKLNELLQQILFSECFERSVSEFGHPVTPRNRRQSSSGNLREQDSFVILVCNWFAEILEKVPPVSEPPGICLSSFLGGATRLPGSSKKAIEADMYFDATEMQALCCIIGAHGYRVLESTLLSSLQYHAKGIKDCLTKNKVQLAAFSKSYMDIKKSESAIQSMSVLYELSYHSIAAGNVLFVMQIAHKALQAVLARTSPLVHEIGVILSTSRSSEPGLLTEILETAYECGGDADISPNVIGVLSNLVKDDEDVALWSLLPYALAASFHSDIWKRSSFVQHLDACDNNAHTMALSAYTLLSVFQPLISPNEEDSNQFSPNSVESLKTFVHVCATVTLQLKLSDDKNSVVSTGLPLFLSKFSDAAKTLDKGYVEHCFPKVLTHSSMIGSKFRLPRAHAEHQPMQHTTAAHLEP